MKIYKIKLFFCIYCCTVIIFLVFRILEYHYGLLKILFNQDFTEIDKTGIEKLGHIFPIA